MLYYQLILGIINQNMRDTTVNPLTIHEIIEKAKDKARAFVKGVGGIPTFLEDWINKKIDPILSLEMTTRNQNGRLTKYNGSFDIKEHFMKTLLKYKKPEEFQAKKSLQELPNILETSKDATNLLAFEPVTGKSSKRIKLIPNPICVNELNNYSPDEREKNSTKDLNESMYSAIHKRQPHLMEFYSPNRNSEGRFRINNLTPLGEHTGRETMLDMKSPKQNFKINSSLTRDKTIYRVQKVLI